jgi:probable phosphoglycerate mutase
MSTLFLIRHGLTTMTGRVLYGQSDGVPLDDRGRAQAERLVERFAGVALTAIYSSPLERCMQTVEPLADAKRLPILARPALIEMALGSWTGRSLAAVRRQRAWRDVQTSPSTFRFPGGESFAEAQERVVADLAAIARRHPRGRVAVATHGDIVRIALAHLSGAPLDAFQRTVIDTGSVSVVSISKGDARILLVNDTGGLDRFAAGPARGTGPQKRVRPNLRG